MLYYVKMYDCILNFLSLSLDPRNHPYYSIQYLHTVKHKDYTTTVI
jgi:hypothetical protein